MAKISQESIAKVKEVTLVDLVQAMGLPVKRSGKQLFVPCPNPAHEETNYEHCAIEIHKNIFHCFTCANVGGKSALTYYSWHNFGKSEGTFKESVLGLAKLMDIEVKDENGKVITAGSNTYIPSVKVVTKSLESQPVQIVDAFYRAFLSLCPLRPEHLKELQEKRRYSTDEIKLNLFRSVPTPDEWIKIYALLKSKNYPFDRIPGLSQIFHPDYYDSKFPRELGEEGEFEDQNGKKHKGRWYYVLNAAKGYFIPVYDENGFIVRLRVRKDSGEPKYVWFSSGHNIEVEKTINKARRNGVSSGAPINISVPPNVLHRWPRGQNICSVMNMNTLLVTEGEHKSKISAKVFNAPVVGLPGAGNFEHLLPLIKKWNVQKLIICYDMDTLQREDESLKSQKKQASLFQIVSNFTVEVAKLGVEAVIWTWNLKDGKGLDDLVLNNKLPIECNLRTGKQRGVTFETIHTL